MFYLPKRTSTVTPSRQLKCDIVVLRYQFLPFGLQSSAEENSTKKYIPANMREQRNELIPQAQKKIIHNKELEPRKFVSTPVFNTKLLC